MASSKKKLLLVLILVMTAGGAILWTHNHPQTPIRRTDGGQPQKSVEAILQERSTQASGSLLTPLGKAFIAKDWSTFKNLYQPATQYHDLAEIIRALYIQNQFSSWTTDDMDEVLKITYNTLERIEPKNRALASLLLTQFYRLPLPQKQSSTYQQLESWVSNQASGTFLNRLSVTKLVQQDLHPSDKVIKSFIAGYQSPLDNVSTTEWIRMTDDIRSPLVRDQCFKELLRLYPKLRPAEKSQALIMLGHEPAINAKSIVKYALESLQSDEQQTFEAGLKTVSNLLNANLLDSNQKTTAVKRLTNLSAELKTPFVNAKIGDLLPKLSTSH
ncbi:MAG: hypothetical protein JST80_06995 [Bdellovibrionales bacterium]|nr:hypothetical protein [Bdellovibrionales bacterium]